MSCKECTDEAANIRMLYYILQEVAISGSAALNNSNSYKGKQCTMSSFLDQYLKCLWGSGRQKHATVRPLVTNKKK